MVNSSGLRGISEAWEPFKSVEDMHEQSKKSELPNRHVNKAVRPERDRDPAGALRALFELSATLKELEELINLSW